MTLPKELAKIRFSNLKSVAELLEGHFFIQIILQIIADGVRKCIFHNLPAFGALANGFGLLMFVPEQSD